MIVGTTERQTAAGGGGQYLSRSALAALPPPRRALPAADRCSAGATGAQAPPATESTPQGATLGLARREGGWPTAAQPLTGAA